MLTKVFKKEGMFSYIRLFFVLIIFVILVALAFGGYVSTQKEQAVQNQQVSDSFFEQHPPRLLQYKQTRDTYIKAYGKSAKSDINKEKQQVIDTYISKDGGKGISITYHGNDNLDEAYLIGYVIIGQDEHKDMRALLATKGETRLDVLSRFGQGSAFVTLENETKFELSFNDQMNKVIYTLQGRFDTDVIEDIKTTQYNA